MASSNFPGYDDGPIYEKPNKIRVPKLLNMSYKNYTWPHNPAIYNIRFSKRIVRHNYLWINNSEVEDMGMEARVMTGSGAFFGKNAYEEFSKLASVFYDEGPGLLIHPVWQDANVLFTSLELKQEPLPDYVEYDFEFTENIEINIIEEITELNSGNGGDGNGGNTSSSTSKGSYTTHVVKQGESLSLIGSKYGVPWRQIAEDNKNLIKDPNLIQIGWQLKIYNPKKNPVKSSTNSNKTTASSGTGDPAYDRFMRDFGHLYGGD